MPSVNVAGGKVAGLRVRLVRFLPVKAADVEDAGRGRGGQQKSNSNQINIQCEGITLEHK